MACSQKIKNNSKAFLKAEKNFFLFQMLQASKFES